MIDGVSGGAWPLCPAAAADDAGAQAAWRDTLLPALQHSLVQLPDKPEESAEATLAVLWQLAAGTPRSVVAALAAEPRWPVLGRAGLAALAALLDRRLGGVPLAHLSGRQHFMGLELLAGPQALIPRAETALLGGAALAALQARLTRPGRARVLDVCTGSGNLALVLAQAAATAGAGAAAEVCGADLSPDAVELARRNARHLGLEAQVRFEVSDLLAAFDGPAWWGQVDLLVCNPPYISSGKLPTLPAEIGAHEPRLAFDGGPLGIGVLQRLLRDAPRFLTPDGVLALEVGLGQGPAVLRRLQAGGAFRTLQPVCDAAGEVRAVVAAR